MQHKNAFYNGNNEIFKKQNKTKPRITPTILIIHCFAEIVNYFRSKIVLFVRSLHNWNICVAVAVVGIRLLWRIIETRGKRIYIETSLIFKILENLIKNTHTHTRTQHKNESIWYYVKFVRTVILYVDAIPLFIIVWGV